MRTRYEVSRPARFPCGERCAAGLVSPPACDPVCRATSQPRGRDTEIERASCGSRGAETGNLAWASRGPVSGGIFRGYTTGKLGSKINIFCNGLQFRKAAVVPSLPLRQPAKINSLRHMISDISDSN